MFSIGQQALLRSSLLALLIFSGSTAFATSKIDALLGFYSLKATTSRGESSISGLGSYQIAYRYQFSTQIDLQVGYSLLASKTIGGDLAFGPDLGFLYFPMTSSGSVFAKSENISIEWGEHFRPYLGLSFHQRQYQSSQSTFAGFSFQAGVDYNFRPQMSWRSDLRIIQLIGPSNAKATEFDLMTGLSFELK